METPIHKYGYDHRFSHGTFHFYFPKPDYLANVLAADKDEHLASVSFESDEHLSLRSSELKLEHTNDCKVITGSITFNVPTPLLHGTQTDSILLKRMVQFLSNDPTTEGITHSIHINSNKLAFETPHGNLTSIHVTTDELYNATLDVTAFIDKNTENHTVLSDGVFIANLWGKLHSFIVSSEQNADTYQGNSNILVGGSSYAEVGDSQLAIESQISAWRYKYGAITLPNWGSDIDAQALIHYEDVHDFSFAEIEKIANDLIREKRYLVSIGYPMGEITHSDIIHFMAEALGRRRQSHGGNNHHGSRTKSHPNTLQVRFQAPRYSEDRGDSSAHLE